MSSSAAERRVLVLLFGPDPRAVAQALALAARGTLALLEDGVLVLADAEAPAPPRGAARTLALAPDLAARGLVAPADVTPIDYGALADLAAAHDVIVSLG